MENLPSGLFWLPAPYRPHLLCRESYHLGAHFGTMLGRFCKGLREFKMVFLWFWGVLKNIKIPFRAPKGLKRPYKANRAPLGNLYAFRSERRSLAERRWLESRAAEALLEPLARQTSRQVTAGVRAL